MGTIAHYLPSSVPLPQLIPHLWRHVYLGSSSKRIEKKKSSEWTTFQKAKKNLGHKLTHILEGRQEQNEAPETSDDERQGPPEIPTRRRATMRTITSVENLSEFEYDAGRSHASDRTEKIYGSTWKNDWWLERWRARDGIGLKRFVVDKLLVDLNLFLLKQLYMKKRNSTDNSIYKKSVLILVLTIQTRSKN